MSLDSPATLVSLWRSLGINLLSLQSAHDLLDRLTPNTSAHTHVKRDAEISQVFRRLGQAQLAVDRLTEHAVQQARLGGMSWTEVGASLGTSSQAAHKRFRHLDTAVVAGGNNLTRTRGFTKSTTKK